MKIPNQQIVVNENWAIADRISDRIVDIFNNELTKMRARGEVDPLQILAGDLLALLSFMSTAPPWPQPSSFTALGEAACKCLSEIFETK